MKSSDAEMKERKALAGSSTEVTSYRDRAVNDIALEAQGRHSAAAKATVTGSARVPQVPRQPEGSPWAGDLVPPEEPTHYDINALEPNGTPAEIEASLREASLSVASLPPDGDVATARTTPPAGAKEASAVSTSAADASTSSSEPGLRRGRRL
jgi:hypothetical protein